MGQAKQRGTFQERQLKAIIRENRSLADALTQTQEKGMPIHAKGFTNRRRTIEAQKRVIKALSHQT